MYKILVTGPPISGKTLVAKKFQEDFINYGSDVANLDVDFLQELGLSKDSSTYANCFGCSTCTSSCPVVQNYDNPVDVLGLLPHQIIHSVALGLKDLALGSRMLWDCLTCYKCQESCPQGVQITEVFYRLKNLSTSSACSVSDKVDMQETV